MAKSDLTAQRLKEVLNYSPETGEWTWPVKVGSKACGDIAGCVARKYRVICVDQRLYMAHRMAWLYMTGEWPKQHVDHIDGNGQNNRWNNLRDVDRCTNLQNRHRADVDSLHQTLGVHKHGDTWVAEIRADGKAYYLGTFKTRADAHAAYLAKKRLLHPLAPIAASASDSPVKLGYPIGSSGLRGTKACGSRWRAFIHTKSGQKHLGMFDTAEDAHAAYIAAKASLQVNTQ